MQTPIENFQITHRNGVFSINNSSTKVSLTDEYKNLLIEVQSGALLPHILRFSRKELRVNDVSVIEHCAAEYHDESPIWGLRVENGWARQGSLQKSPLRFGQVFNLQGTYFGLGYLKSGNLHGPGMLLTKEAGRYLLKSGSFINGKLVREIYTTEEAKSKEHICFAAEQLLSEVSLPRPWDATAENSDDFPRQAWTQKFLRGLMHLSVKNLSASAYLYEFCRFLFEFWPTARAEIATSPRINKEIARGLLARLDAQITDLNDNLTKAWGVGQTCLQSPTDLSRWKDDISKPPTNSTHLDSPSQRVISSQSSHSPESSGLLPISTSTAPEWNPRTDGQEHDARRALDSSTTFKSTRKIKP